MWPALPAPVSFVASALLVSTGGVLARICLPSIARTRAAKVAFVALVASFARRTSFGCARRSRTRIGARRSLRSSCVSCPSRSRASRSPRSFEASRRSRSRRIATGDGHATRGARRGDGDRADRRRVGTGICGFTTASAPPRVPRMRFAFRRLHPKLRGVRILHLSDLHLGVEKHVEDLEALFDALQDRTDPISSSSRATSPRTSRELGPALDATVALRAAPRRVRVARQPRVLPRRGAAARIYAQKRDVRSSCRPARASRGSTRLRSRAPTIPSSSIGDPDAVPRDASIDSRARRRALRRVSAAPVPSPRRLRPRERVRRPPHARGPHARRPDRLQRQERVRADLARPISVGPLLPWRVASLHDERLRPLVPVSLDVPDGGADHRARYVVTSTS